MVYYIDFGEYGKLFFTALHLRVPFPTGTGTYDFQSVYDDAGNSLFNGVYLETQNALALGTNIFLSNNQTVYDVTRNCRIERASNGAFFFYVGDVYVNCGRPASYGSTAAISVLMIMDSVGAVEFHGYGGSTYGNTVAAITFPSVNSIGTCKFNGAYESSNPRAYFRNVQDKIQAALHQYIPDPDPYLPGGHSTTGGGGGTFDLNSDPIGIPPLPTLSFASTGFTRIYNPTLSELNALANYLWTDQTFLDTVINHLKQLLENPMDAVISLSLVPCPVPNGSPEAVKVMYINTGVTMSPATTQFVDVDCGTYTIEEFYGSALDYNPYTKVHCYLPYIGQVTLDTDEVMGRTLRVVYRIDIVTGMCAAMILVDQNVLYQFSGHCAINMPINSADFSGYIGAAMTAGKMVAGVAAGASGNLPLAAELIGAPAPKVTSTSETTETVKTRNPKTGRQVTQWSDTKQRKTTASGASFGEMTRKAAANTVGAVMGGKLTVEHAGGFTGNSGYLAVRRPYLIIERPRMCNPEEYGAYNGRPSMIYMNLGDCEGYTEVQSIQFKDIPATNPELAELSELLKSGVLF